MTARQPNRPFRRAGFTLYEILIGLGLFSLLIGVVLLVLRFSNRSTIRISSQLALHQESRKALVRFLQELQEGIEVLTPTPGSTLSFAIIRDKYSTLRWYYQVPSRQSAGTFELRRYIHDRSIPEAKRTETLLQSVRRLTFTSRSEGALQIHLQLADDTQEYLHVDDRSNAELGCSGRALVAHAGATGKDQETNAVPVTLAGVHQGAKQ